MKSLLDFLLCFGIFDIFVIGFAWRRRRPRGLKAKSRGWGSGKAILKTRDALIDQVIDRVDDIVDQ